ncbi:hypothetical protein ACFX10_040177 [Malus domestica]
MGYYWPSMVNDCLEHAKRCQACQFHANFIHQPPEPLHPIAASWPFDAWGLDVVGPIMPKSYAGEAYIMVATYYFSKWAEAIPQKEVKKETFSNRLVDELCEKYKMTYRTFTQAKPYSLVYGMEAVLPLES